MDSLNKLEKNLCCGCGACSAVCPKDAIQMRMEKDGFLYPSINSDLCIECGVCLDKCPQYNFAARTKAETYFVAQIKDAQSLQRSSSGGLFFLLATEFISRGGAVVGCTFNEDHLPTLVLTRSLETVHSMQGSKYPQAEVKTDLFIQIRKELDRTGEVLIFGTPCQIAAMKSYLGEDREGIYYVDLICHGQGSRWLFERYLHHRTQKIGNPEEISFRDKSKYSFPNNYVMKIKGNKGRYERRATRDPYCNAFSQGRILRESCYKCQYANKERLGDLTIGDYFDIAKIKTDGRLDMSIVLENTNRGGYYLVC